MIGPRYIIVAYNINSGGGKILLEDLVKYLPPKSIVFCDLRMSFTFLRNDIEYRYIRPTFLARYKAEVLLRRMAKLGDKMICFGNLPPLFNSRAKVTLFVQNRFLIDNKRDQYLSRSTMLKMSIERLWLSKFINNADQVVVQTNSMARLFKSKFPDFRSLLILPIVDDELRALGTNRKRASGPLKDFIYVASGDGHKNHQLLFEALIVLADKNIYPTVSVTLDVNKYPKLEQRRLEINSKYGVKVENLGILPHYDLISKMSHFRALMYPSLIESFGLPLLEAKTLGLDVLASDLDYVWDVSVPDVVFDPLSSKSIARGMEEYLCDRYDPKKIKSDRPCIVVQSAGKLLESA